VIQIGSLVNITEGPERGGWGRVRQIVADSAHVTPDNYHVAISDGEDVRIFQRGQLSSRAPQPVRNTYRQGNGS
jgi:ribosomal protein L24